MRNALSRFATQHPADSALDTQAGANPSLVLELRHILALRLALPFTYVSFPGDASPEDYIRPRRMPFIQLKGRYIAQLTQGESVMVRDLVSGASATFRGQAREKIMGLALSTEIIAFVTYTGILYVASLGDLIASPSPVRLPSSLAFTMAANGNTVAVLLGHPNIPSVVVYHAETRRSISFTLEASRIAKRTKGPSSYLEVCTMAVNGERGIIDFAALSFPFNGSEEKTSGLRVLVYRFSLAGEYVRHTAWWPRLHNLPGTLGGDSSLGPLQATGERGLFSMELAYRYDDPPSVTPVSAKLTLLYDEDDMSLKAVDWMESRSQPHYTDSYHTRPVLWKDRLYRATPQEGLVPAFHVNFRSETGYDELDVGPHALRRLKDQTTDPPAPDILANYSTRDVSPRLWPLGVRMRPEMGDEGLCDFLLMNDSFAVTASAGPTGSGYPVDIKIACLDERVKLHGAESTKLWDQGAKSSMRCDSGIEYILPSSV
jgi:hypothetical protein